jgi:hypothetical protein
VSGYTIVTGTASSSSSVASCPTGKKVLGGGGSIGGGGQMTASYPSSQTAWTATNGGLGTVTAYAICATVV